VCDWCVQAFRRLAAVSGGHIAFNLAEAAAPPAAIVRGTGRAASPPGPAILITELAEQLLDGSGTAYVVRIFGHERADATWEGWLEFMATDGSSVLRTARETTQSKREDLAYWALGLEPSYLEGAFARARRQQSG
jgi:hypothetical protein